jgi:hypothetical protein
MIDLCSLAWKIKVEYADCYLTWLERKDCMGGFVESDTNVRHHFTYMKGKAGSTSS